MRRKLHCRAQLCQSAVFVYGRAAKDVIMILSAICRGKEDDDDDVTEKLGLLTSTIIIENQLSTSTMWDGEG